MHPGLYPKPIGHLVYGTLGYQIHNHTCHPLSILPGWYPSYSWSRVQGFPNHHRRIRTSYRGPSRWAGHDGTCNGRSNQAVIRGPAVRIAQDQFLIPDGQTVPVFVLRECIQGKNWIEGKEDFHLNLYWDYKSILRWVSLFVSNSATYKKLREKSHSLFNYSKLWA